MQVGRFRSKRKDLSIDFGDGDVLELTYDPNFLTPNAEDELRDSKTSAELAKFLEGMLLDWDLTNEDGTPFDISYENLCTLPVTVLGLVTTAIAEDQNEQTRAEGKASPAISPQTASSASSQPGTT